MKKKKIIVLIVSIVLMLISFNVYADDGYDWLRKIANEPSDDGHDWLRKIANDGKSSKSSNNQSRQCPCRLVLNGMHVVVLVNKNNQVIKRYDNTMNRSNCEVYTDGNRFWVRRLNNWVWVYDVESGRNIKNYNVPRGSKQSWVR
jgi:hypothetical protein